MKRTSKSETPRRPPSKRIAGLQPDPIAAEKLTISIDKIDGVFKIRKLDEVNDFKIKLKLPTSPAKEPEENRRKSTRPRKVTDYTQLSVDDVFTPKSIKIEKKEPELITPIKEKAPPKQKNPEKKIEPIKKITMTPRKIEETEKPARSFKIKIPKQIIENIKQSEEVRVHNQINSDTTTSSPGHSKEEPIEIQSLLERKVYNITFGSEFQTPECINSFYERIRTKFDDNVKKSFYESFTTDAKYTPTMIPPKIPIRDDTFDSSPINPDFRFDLEIITNHNQREKIKVTFQPGKVNPFTEVPNPYDKVLREEFFKQFNFTMDYRSGYAPINIQAQQEKEMNYKQHFIKKKQSCANTRLKRVCGVSYVKQNESQQLNVNHVFAKLPPLVFQGSNGCQKLDEYEPLMKQVYQNLFEDCSKVPLIVTTLEAEDELLMREYLNFPERRLRLARGKVWIVTSFDSMWKFVRDRLFICIHLIYDPKILLKKPTVESFTQDELARVLAESNVQLGLLCRKSTSGKKSFVKTFFEGDFTDDDEDEDPKPKAEGGDTEQKTTIIKKRGRKPGYRKIKEEKQANEEKKRKKRENDPNNPLGLKKRQFHFFDKARDIMGKERKFPVESMEDFNNNFFKIMEPYYKILFPKDKKPEPPKKPEEEPIKQPTVDEVIFENSLLSHMGGEVHDSNHDSNVIISKSTIQNMEQDNLMKEDEVVKKLDFDIDIHDITFDGAVSQVSHVIHCENSKTFDCIQENEHSIADPIRIQVAISKTNAESSFMQECSNSMPIDAIMQLNKNSENQEIIPEKPTQDSIIENISKDSEPLQAKLDALKNEEPKIEETHAETSALEKLNSDLKPEKTNSGEIKIEGDQANGETKVEENAENENDANKEDKWAHLPESLAELRRELKSDPKGNIQTMSMRVELYVHEESWKTSDRHTKNILYSFSEYVNLAILENFRTWTDHRLDIFRNNDSDSLLDTDNNIQYVEVPMFYNDKAYKTEDYFKNNNLNWRFDPSINKFDENIQIESTMAIPSKSKKPTLETLQEVREKDLNTFSFPIYLITTRDSFAFDLIEKVTIVDMMGRKVKKTEFFFDPNACPSNFKGFVDKFPDYRVGVTTYNDFFSHEELSAIEKNCYETERKFFSNHYLPMTGQMTCTSEKVRRTKFFFGARYIWTRQQLSDAHSMVGAGIRVDVSSAPKWIKNLVEKPMVDAGIIEKDFINSIAMNVYHDGKEGLAQHFDDAVRFKQPIFTLRIFSDSRLSFGSQFYGFCNGAFSIPMPRGCITVLEEESYSANGIKHCVRPCDMTGKSSAIILRQMHHKVFNEAKIYDEFVDFPAWFSTLSIQDNAVPYFEQKRIEAEDILKGNTAKKDY